jgi:hypothetical protein
MWQMSEIKTEPDQLITDIVQTSFSEPRFSEVHKKYAEFAETVWRMSATRDIRICMSLVSAYLPERRERAIRLLTDYIETANDPSPAAIVRLVDLLRIEFPAQAIEVVERFKANVLVPEFHVAWAKVIVKENKVDSASALLEDPAFRSEAVRALDPPTMYRLLKIAERDNANEYLREALDSVASVENMAQVQAVSEIFYQEGDADELEYRLGKWFRTDLVQEILTKLRRRVRRGRLQLVQAENSEW